ncbi:MAG: transglutaminase family protein [Candidatus Fibromonas sp.]|nr:transglutaminase family protein [Candidatus Fibromonas sp.]
MKTVNFQYKTELLFSSPASDHSFLLRILPQSDNRQCIKNLLWYIDPPGTLWRASDSFGNKTLSGRIDTPHNHFSFSIQGTAEMSDAQYISGPEPERILLYPTKLTQPGNELANFHGELEHSAPGDALQRIRYFSHAVHTRLRYERGITTNSTTAQQAFDMGTGVCQDYSHILLALLRLNGIPCRYVAGLASDYGETHAWVESWIADRYYGIDPTRDKFIDEGYIAISRGRDFEDCSIERGIFKGACRGTQTISLSMEFLQ